MTERRSASPLLRLLPVLSSFVLLTGVQSLHAAIVTVPGTSDMWLAGMPNGSNNGSDSAPAHSPVLVGGLTLIPGTPLTFTNAIGGVLHTPGCSTSAPFSGCSPIDGSTFFDHSGGDSNGIGALRAPINSLLGVFLGPQQPDATPAPGGLNFQTLGLDLETLSPELKQPFFIGDGHTAGDVEQQFFVPGGATRLYLGTMDGFGWFNNTGAITVTVTAVPEPETVLLWLAGIGFLAATSRRAGRQVLRNAVN
jgi:hypothetical protein